MSTEQKLRYPEFLAWCERHDLPPHLSREAYDDSASIAQPPAPEQQENEADELLRNLGLDPDRYRTEAGFINHRKVKAAIRHPEQYPQLAAPEQQAPHLRQCEFCGCKTNAKARACCEKGRFADRHSATPEQQAPQGIKLTHVFTPDVDAEQHKLCEKYRDLVQGVEKQDELKNALWSLDFYKARCDLLQKWQSKMRDPERTIVCDILANGQTMPDPTGARYGLPTAPEAAKPESLSEFVRAGNMVREEIGERVAHAAAEMQRETMVKPETERSELINKLRKVKNWFPGASVHEVCEQAAALLAADSKAGGEPVAEIVASRYGGGYSHSYNLKWFHGVSPLPKGTKLYTHPQQQAKPLTDEKPSPTAGMNIAQRILHVGGRNNAAGYVEFGSIQAVQALVHQVLRDLPGCAPRATGCPCAMDETAQDAVERKQSDIPAILKDQAS